MHLPRLFRAIVVALAGVSAVAIAQSPGVTFKSHSDVEAALGANAKATPGADMVSTPILQSERYRMSVVHRVKPQGAIAHDVGTEIHSIVSGSGTLVTGGTIVRAAGAERGAGKIENGQARRVSKGDMVVVPPKTPHWYMQIDGEITYLEIRFDVGAPPNGPAMVTSAADLLKGLAEKGSAAAAPLMFATPVGRGDKYQANVVRRTKAQGAAAHETGAEVHQILEGSGTFVTGGAIVRPTGGTNAQPGAATVTGGDSRHVQKGDIVFIPANTPHWYKELDGTITYLEVRFDVTK